MFRWSRDCHHATMCHLWPSHRFLDRTKTKLESFLRKLSETFWEVWLFVSCSSLFLHRDRCFAQSEVRRRLAVVLSGSAAKGYTAPMVVGRMAEVMSNLLLQQFPNSTTQYCKTSPWYLEYLDLSSSLWPISVLINPLNTKPWHSVGFIFILRF